MFDVNTHVMLLQNDISWYIVRGKKEQGLVTMVSAFYLSFLNWGKPHNNGLKCECLIWNGEKCCFSVLSNTEIMICFLLFGLSVTFDGNSENLYAGTSHLLVKKSLCAKIIFKGTLPLQYCKLLSICQKCQNVVCTAAGGDKRIRLLHNKW